MPNIDTTSEGAAAQIDLSSMLAPHLAAHVDETSEAGRFHLDPDKLPEKDEESQDSSAGTAIENETLVDWDGPDDSKNPRNWSPARKWATIALVSAITFNT